MRGGVASFQCQNHKSNAICPLFSSKFVPVGVGPEVNSVYPLTIISHAPELKFCSGYHIRYWTALFLLVSPSNILSMQSHAAVTSTDRPNEVFWRECLFKAYSCVALDPTQLTPCGWLHFISHYVHIKDTETRLCTPIGRSFRTADTGTAEAVRVTRQQQ